MPREPTVTFMAAGLLLVIGMVRVAIDRAMQTAVAMDVLAGDTLTSLSAQRSFPCAVSVARQSTI